jgi:hypothetical protein
MKYIALVKRNGVFASQDDLRITEVTETRVRGLMAWPNGLGAFQNLTWHLNLTILFSRVTRVGTLFICSKKQMKLSVASTSSKTLYSLFGPVPQNLFNMGI